MNCSDRFVNLVDKHLISSFPSILGNSDQFCSILFTLLPDPKAGTDMCCQPSFFPVRSPASFPWGKWWRTWPTNTASLCWTPTAASGPLPKPPRGLACPVTSSAARRRCRLRSWGARGPGSPGSGAVRGSARRSAGRWRTSCAVGKPAGRDIGMWDPPAAYSTSDPVPPPGRWKTAPSGKWNWGEWDPSLPPYHPCTPSMVDWARAFWRCRAWTFSLTSSK